jgi:hypothetical protein
VGLYPIVRNGFRFTDKRAQSFWDERYDVDHYAGDSSGDDDYSSDDDIDSDDSYDGDYDDDVYSADDDYDFEDDFGDLDIDDYD